MKKTTIIVNIARGAAVVTDALVAALRDGVIGGAALDVTDPEPLPGDHPLLSCRNCLVVSHIASATVPTRTTMSRVTAQAIIDALSGKRITYCANPTAYDSTNFRASLVVISTSTLEPRSTWPPFRMVPSLNLSTMVILLVYVVVNTHCH
jgi:hypothetical protein